MKKNIFSYALLASAVLATNTFVIAGPKKKARPDMPQHRTDLPPITAAQPLLEDYEATLDDLAALAEARPDVADLAEDHATAVAAEARTAHHVYDDEAEAVQYAQVDGYGFPREGQDPDATSQVVLAPTALTEARTLLASFSYDEEFEARKRSRGASPAASDTTEVVTAEEEYIPEEVVTAEEEYIPKNVARKLDFSDEEDEEGEEEETTK